MITIWKYEIHNDEAEIAMPEGAEVLHVAPQPPGLFLWARVDTDKPTVKRRFQVVGTGHHAPENGTYVGTAHIMNGTLVLHVFELDKT